MTQHRLLVVEDDPMMLRLVLAVLQSDGYEVRTMTDGSSALELVSSWKPDLILLDIHLPGALNGFDLCRMIRDSSQVPIVMLTGRGGTEDKVRGFEAGADDYVTKPFSSRELLARVKAVLRRSAPSGEQVANPEPVIRGGWHIDLGQQRAVLDGREITLTATEFRLLVELARNGDQVIPHDRLLESVWGPEYRQEIDYLRTYVRRLRKKIGDDASNPRHILSRTNVGYMLAT